MSKNNIYQYIYCTKKLRYVIIKYYIFINSNNEIKEFQDNKTYRE